MLISRTLTLCCNAQEQSGCWMSIGTSCCVRPVDGDVSLRHPQVKGLAVTRKHKENAKMNTTVSLSNAGSNGFRGDKPCDRVVIGTVDGIFVLSRHEEDWRVIASRGLEGCNVSSVTQLPSGTLLAATHGLGVARSIDGGNTWDWSNQGITPIRSLVSTRWSFARPAGGAWLDLCRRTCSLPQDDGVTWQELPAIREVAKFSVVVLPSTASPRPHQGDLHP